MRNIVYMGTPEYAAVILQALLDESEISVDLVLTQPDRPVGRKKTFTAPPVKVLAEDNGIEVLQPLTLKNSEIVAAIERAKPDLIVVAAYGQLLPKEVLDIAPCINLHASILPKYRGASPIQQSLLNGDEYSGVTAMLMEEGLDTGAMLGFKYIKTAKAPRLDIMTERLSEMAASLCIDVVKEFEYLEPIEQLGASASKCKKIQRADGLVDFTSAKLLSNKAAAFFGWPGLFLENGTKLHGVRLIEESATYKEGEILAIEEDAVIVGCSVGSVKIEQLQAKSKAKIAAKAYISGKRLKVGDTLL
jgi:methionyl-tRNA formyltransferase